MCWLWDMQDVGTLFGKKLKQSRSRFKIQGSFVWEKLHGLCLQNRCGFNPDKPLVEVRGVQCRYLLGCLHPQLSRWRQVCYRASSWWRLTAPWKRLWKGRVRLCAVLPALLIFDCISKACEASEFYSCCPEQTFAANSPLEGSLSCQQCRWIAIWYGFSV